MKLRNIVWRCIVVLAAVNTIAAQGGATSGLAVDPLAPGDLVRVIVWREPDLSGDFVINEDGVLTLPLLGRIDVRRISLDELRDSLMSAYAVQLRNPVVTITPMRRIHVLGEVARPGLYPADPTITLAGVVALAGGATATGSLDRIRVVRDGVVISRNVDLGSSLRAGGFRSGDQIFVDRRSWMDRNGPIVASTAISAVSLVLSLVLAR